MRPYRPLALALLLVTAFGAESLVGRAGQTPAALAGGAQGSGPFDALHFRSIGPASMSGRISDLAVYEANPSIFYVGTAHGGVWKTTNAGTTFEAQFQDQGLLSIGDVTVSQSNPDLVWVGTGESNNRQSTSWGDGVYKSTDGGKTYVNVGLRTSRFINRILIDPRNNEVVFVAATGSLFGPGGERGVYKTTDGGKTWKRTLHVDEDTGANDLVMDPDEQPGSVRLDVSAAPYRLLHERRRAGQRHLEVHRRRRDVDAAQGRPAGRAARPHRPRPVPPAAEHPLRAGRRAVADRASGAAADEAPQGGGRGATVATGVDATPTGLYRSDDAGATWRKVNNENPRPMYFSQVRVDPNDPECAVLRGRQAAPLARWRQDRHAQRHPDDSRRCARDLDRPGEFEPCDHRQRRWRRDLLGPGEVLELRPQPAGRALLPRERGQRDALQHLRRHAGQLRLVRAERRARRRRHRRLQLGDLAGRRRLRRAAGPGGLSHGLQRVAGRQHGARRSRHRRDGFDAAARPLRVSRRSAGTGTRPLVMSPHDPKIIYAASNKLFRSSNRGLNWESSGTDLTTNASRDDIVTMGVKGSDIRIARDDGIQAWPSIISFAESAKRAGVLYAGTDDGNLQVSRDTGRSWTNVSDRIPGLPKGIWVSEVVPSRFDEGTVYATFDGHRQNDFETYIYVSRDFGQTWQSASGDLKGEVIKTMTEDLKNPDVLYVGAETGLFVSIDRAKSWVRVKANLPTVRIDEITLHARDNAMVLATHGRAIWVLDHLEPIQEYAAAQSVASDADALHAAALRHVPAARPRPQLRVLGRPDVLRREPAAGGGHLVVQQEAGRRRQAAHHRSGREGSA